MRFLDFRQGGRARLGALVGVLSLVAVACETGDAQDVLSPAGEFARSPDRLWDLTFGIAVAVFILVEGILVFTLFRYRSRPDRKASQFHGNTKVEILLTAIPALILAGIAVPTVSTIFDLAEPREGALQIKVIGHQFWWEYQYLDEGFVTANELHIPTNTPVELTVEGGLIDRVTGDAQVIHSFWAPRLAGKQDLIPGHANQLFIEADDPGIYFGQCTEFCGLGHAEMRLRVYAESGSDFEQWVSDQKSAPEAPSGGSLAERGQKLFAEGQFREGLNCAACHAVEATPEDVAPNQGPNLAHFASRDTFASAIFKNTEENLKAWIADPASVKPGARMPALGLTESEIDAVVAYLKTLE
nr:cytochrome c oxidase subunit II [Actinomycetota bacterium]